MNIWFMMLIIDEEWRSCLFTIIIIRMGVIIGLLLRIRIIWFVTQLIGATELPVIPSALHPATLLSISLLVFCYMRYLLYWDKTSQPSYLRSLLSFPLHRCTRSSSRITLSRPFLTSRFKIPNRSYYHSAPVLWNNLPSDLRHVAHHVTP